MHLQIGADDMLVHIGCWLQNLP